jgi:uncharacterized RDD family membrane protein YckC
MLCPKCNVQNPDNSRFCKECGSQLKDASPIKKTYVCCPKCNTENRETSKICMHCGSLLKIAPPEPPDLETQTNIPYHAGLWRRSLAFFIDSAILGAALLVVTLFFALIFTGPSSLLSGSVESIKTSALSRGLFSFYFTAPLFLLLIGWLYFTFLESSKSRATPGKMAAEIFVTDSENQTISLKKANKRSLIKIFPLVIILFLFIIDFPVLLKIIVLLLSLSFFLPLGLAKQTIPDRIADTLVLRKEGPVSLGKKLPLTMVGQIEEVAPNIPETLPKKEIAVSQEPVLTRDVPPDEILSKIKELEGKDVVTYAKLGNDGWLCICGTLMNAGFTKCSLCQREKYFVLNNYTKEEAVKDYQEGTLGKKHEKIVIVHKEEETPLLERETPHYRILEKLKNIEGKDVITYAKTNGIEWLCVCGTLNKVHKCMLCKRFKNYVLEKYNKERVLGDFSTEAEVKQEKPIVEQKDSHPPADVKKEELTAEEKPVEEKEIPLAKEAPKTAETKKEEKTEPEEEQQEKKEISLEKLAPSQEMLNLLKKIEGNDFINYARQEKEKWLCVCGNINSVSFEECINCKRKRSDVLAKYTKEKLEGKN